jgi:hypothetical protein
MSVFLRAVIPDAKKSVGEWAPIGRKIPVSS